MNLKSWISKPLRLAVYAILPYFFLHLTAYLFGMPVWNVALPISALVSGVCTVTVVSVLIKRNCTANSQPDKSAKFLLSMAFIVGLVFPLVCFIIAGLILMTREIVPLSHGLEALWISFLAGVTFGQPLWLFSVPWAFVVVYGLARSFGTAKAAKAAFCRDAENTEEI